MVVGGNPGGYEVEIVDLGGNGLSCSKSNCPLQRDAVGTFINGMAIACNQYPIDSKCFVYNDKV